MIKISIANNLITISDEWGNLIDSKTIAIENSCVSIAFMQFMAILDALNTSAEYTDGESVTIEVTARSVYNYLVGDANFYEEDPYIDYLASKAKQKVNELDCKVVVL